MYPHLQYVKPGSEVELRRPISQSSFYQSLYLIFERPSTWSWHTLTSTFSICFSVQFGIERNWPPAEGITAQDWWQDIAWTWKVQWSCEVSQICIAGAECSAANKKLLKEFCEDKQELLLPWILLLFPALNTHNKAAPPQQSCSNFAIMSSNCDILIL